jgi:hypothetical protein
MLKTIALFIMSQSLGHAQPLIDQYSPNEPSGMYERLMGENKVKVVLHVFGREDVARAKVIARDMLDRDYDIADRKKVAISLAAKAFPNDQQFQKWFYEEIRVAFLRDQQKQRGLVQ